MTDPIKFPPPDKYPYNAQDGGHNRPYLGTFVTDLLTRWKQFRCPHDHLRTRTYKNVLARQNRQEFYCFDCKKRWSNEWP